MALKVKVRVENDKVTPELKRLRRKIPQSLRDAVKAIAFDIRNTAMASMQTAKSGIVYREGTATEHQASKPGEPPATDTGDLLAHITVNSTRTYTDVGAQVLHGLYMEEGTKRGGRFIVEPRPWLMPAYDKHSRKLEVTLLRELGRGS